MMRRIACVAIIVVFAANALTAMAQAPVRGGIAVDTAPFTYSVDGVRVIQRINRANDVVAVNVYLLGGTALATASTQGIERLYLEAAEFGTASYDESLIRRRWAATGAFGVIDSDWDWTLVGFRGIGQEFDSAWNVFADRIARPALSPASIQRARDKLVSEVRRQRDHPDGELLEIADSLAYAGHPYGFRPDGTVATLLALDSAQIASYVTRTVTRSRLLVVVVGNISREAVEAAVARTLARLPAGDYQWTLPSAPSRQGATVELVPRGLATNYIIGVFDGPRADSPDLAAYRMATAWLGARIGGAVRETRGLSYVATAGMRDRAVTAGNVYVTTTRPDTVVTLMREQLNQMRQLAIGGYNLRGFSEPFVLELVARRATNAAQADLLARMQLFHGDFRAASRLEKAYAEVSVSDIRAVAQKYFRDVRFVYLGDTLLVKRETFTRPKP